MVNRLTQYEIKLLSFSNSVNRLTLLVNRLTQDGKQFSKRFSNSVNRLTHLVNRLTQGGKQFSKKFFNSVNRLTQGRKEFSKSFQTVLTG